MADPNVTPPRSQERSMEAQQPSIEHFAMSPPDYNDGGGLCFNVSSMLQRDIHYGSHDQLVSDSSTYPQAAPAAGEATNYINKFLSLEPFSRIKKHSSISTIPESSSLVTQAKEQGIGVGDHIPAGAMDVKHSSVLATPPSLPRAASTGQLPKLPDIEVVTPETVTSEARQKFRTIPDSTSPSISHRDLNQFAPLHF